MGNKCNIIARIINISFEFHFSFAYPSDTRATNMIVALTQFGHMSTDSVRTNFDCRKTERHWPCSHLSSHPCIVLHTEYHSAAEATITTNLLCIFVRPDCASAKSALHFHGQKKINSNSVLSACTHGHPYIGHETVHSYPFFFLLRTFAHHFNDFSSRNYANEGKPSVWPKQKQVIKRNRSGNALRIVACAVYQIFWFSLWCRIRSSTYSTNRAVRQRWI